MQFVDRIVYLNDVRVRLDSGMNPQVEALQHEFVQRGLGGLAFTRPVDTSALREFLQRFARPVESEEDAAELRRSLEQFRDLALEILEPQALEDPEEDPSLRVDRKTFALQTYA